MSRFAIGIAVGVLAVGGLVTAGCGGGTAESAFVPTAGADSPYCGAYREWKVYELDHGEAFDQPSPGALRRYWAAYLGSEESLLRHAPAEIRAAVRLKVRFIRTRLTPLLSRYGFDLDRLRRDATDAEQATLFQAPPEAVQEAQAAQYAYEDRACGTQPSPPAADVRFDDGPSSTPYCTALTALNHLLDRIASSGFDPAVTRAVVTSDRFEAALDRLEAAAPPEIAPDIAADHEWFRTRWADVLSSYGYDLRRIYVDATPEDLAVFNRTHPDVIEHTSRETAYEEQICELR